MGATCTKAQRSLCINTGSPEPLLEDNAIRIKISSAGSSTVYLGSLIIVELQIVGLDLWQHQIPGNTQ